MQNEKNKSAKTRSTRVIRVLFQILERSPLNIIQKYFPSLSSSQEKQFSSLEELYRSWNEKINVISRKDMDHFFERHVLHSLAIAKVISFKPSTKILDFGTGGGFPGIPLAIMFPESQFHLVDSIGKKILVVQEITNALGLTNVKAEKKRVEELNGKYDFIVCRAVTDFNEIISWTRNKIRRESSNAIPNGLLCLKGGNLDEELSLQKNMVKIFELKTFFEEEFFVEKKIVYLPLKN